MVLPHDVFQKIDGRNIQLLISCNSNSVQGTLLYFESGNDPVVLGRISKPFAHVHNNDSATIKNQTIHALESLCKELSLVSGKMYQIDDMLIDHQKIHGVVLTLSSPWVLRKSHREKVEFAQPTLVNAESIFESISRDIPQGFSRLDSTIVGIAANGYATKQESVVGKMLEELEISFIDSFVNFQDLETLFQVITTQLNVEAQQCVAKSTLGSVAMNVMDSHKPRGSFALIHMHGNYSDIAIFVDDKLQDTQAVFGGYNTFLSKCAGGHATSNFEKERSLLVSHKKGHLHEDELQKILIVTAEETQKIFESIFDVAHKDNLDCYLIHDEGFPVGLDLIIDEQMKKNRIVALGDCTSFVGDEDCGFLNDNQQSYKQGFWGEKRPVSR